MNACPRCREPLEAMQVDTLNGRMCRACAGMLLKHTDLVNVVEASWRAVTEETVEATPFRAPDGWQNEPVFNCPDCQQPMEKYGYMGIAAIQLDRCNNCEIVWLDANELQNMVLAFAKDSYRDDHDLEAELESLRVPGLGAIPGEPDTTDWLFHDDAGNNVAVAAQILLSLLLR